MSRVIKYLKQFNRKERSILLTYVLRGDPQAEEVFLLNDRFKKELGDELGVEIPDDAFVAMDYHLDWLQMALFLGVQSCSVERETISNSNPQLFEANQRDIDLLIAFEETEQNRIHIVLIEAKAGTDWVNDQLEKKAARLKAIFDKKQGGVKVKPYFVMMSPRPPPDRINAVSWPDFVMSSRRHWLELPLCDGLRKVRRCKAEGNGDEVGHLFIEEYQNCRWKRLSSM